MLTKLWSKRRSILLTWLMSYLAILTLTISLSILIYFEAGGALRSEIRQSNETLLQQVQEVMDKQIAEVMRLHTALLLDPQLNYLMYSDKSTAETLYTTSRVIEDFRGFQIYNSLVDQFYVYWKATDSLLMPGKLYESKIAYESLHLGGGLSYADWHALLQRQGFHGFVPLPRNIGDGSIRNSLAYIGAMSSGMNSPNVGSIVILVDVDRLIQNVELFNRGEVFILSGDGRVIVSNTAEPGTALSFPGKLEGDRAFFYDKYNGVDSEVLYIKSQTTDLKYVSIIPSRVVWGKAEYIRRFTYISILISLLGAGMLTFMFLRRNYMPVQRLVETLSDPSNEREGWQSNEFGFIQRIVSNTLSEKEQIGLRLKLQNNVMRSNTLVRLLKGKLDGYVPLDEAMTTFHISFDSDQFAVILLCFEDESAFLESLKGSDLNEKVKLLHFIVANVVQELADREHRGYVAEVDQGMACIVNFRQAAAAGGEPLFRIAEEARQFLLAQYRIRLKIAVSSVCHSIVGIARAYQEALEAMEYKVVMGDKDIIVYDELQRDMQEQAVSGFYYPLQAEQQLINYMKVGDVEKAQSVLDDIRQRNSAMPIVSVHMVKCLMFNLVSTMIKTTNENGAMEESFLTAAPQWYDAVIKADTMNGMYAQLSRLLEEVCGHASAKLALQAKASRGRLLDDLIQDVMNFVHVQYKDVNLNISSIGEHFQLKPTYLSGLFKARTGEGLLDFINKVRVGKAKEMMIFDQCSVHEAAKFVGFNETATFIRVFKKFEGITPGKFKEINGGA